MKRVAIIGSGPAGLMAADVLSSEQISVHIFDQRPGPGRKLFIAGSSGLNITNDLPLDEFAAQYRGGGLQTWQDLLRDFGRDQWLSFLGELGVESFLGTSGRYFVKTMNAGLLMRLWRRRLTERGVRWSFGAELVNISRCADHCIELEFAGDPKQKFDAVLLALGGASYEETSYPLRWPGLLQRHGIELSPFHASNVGYEVSWSQEFLKEASYQPIKNILFKSALGSMRGDLLVTDYGLEGTPIYTYGTPGLAHIDLKPDLSFEQLIDRLTRSKERIKPLRMARKALNLSGIASALLFHMSDARAMLDPREFALSVKSFPLNLNQPRPLTEAISSAGGVKLDEIDEHWMLKRIPGVFAAGEMLDWDAPTGGFLIQGCVSQGFAAAKSMLRILDGAA